MVYKDFYGRGRRSSFGLYPHDENSYPRPTIRAMMDFPSPVSDEASLPSPAGDVVAVPTITVSCCVEMKQDEVRDGEILMILEATVVLRRAMHDGTLDFYAADQKKRDQRMDKKLVKNEISLLEYSLLKTIGLRRRMHEAPCAFIDLMSDVVAEETLQTLILDKNLISTCHLRGEMHETRYGSAISATDISATKARGQDRQFLEILSATRDVRRAIHSGTFDFYASVQKKREQRLMDKQMAEDLAEIDVLEFNLLKTTGLRRRFHEGPVAFIDWMSVAGAEEAFENMLLDQHLLLTRDLRKGMHEIRYKPRIGMRRDWNQYIAVNQVRQADRDAVFDFWAAGWQDRVLEMSCSMRRRIMQVPETIMEEEEEEKEDVHYDDVDVTASDNVSADPAALRSLMQSNVRGTEGQSRGCQGSFSVSFLGVNGFVNCGGVVERLDILEQTLEMRSSWHEEADNWLYYSADFLQESLDLRSSWQAEADEWLYYAMDPLADSAVLRSGWQDQADLWVCYAVYFPEDSRFIRMAWNLPGFD